MKKIRPLFGVFLICLTTSLSAGNEWVSYDFSGGRFGDNLLAYLHGKWFAFEHNMPFLYRPFKYSDRLRLHDADSLYGTVPSPTYRAQLSRWPLKNRASLNVIYMCPYFPDILTENTSIEQLKSFVGQYSFPVDWENCEFRKMVRELIAPKEPLALTHPPSGVVSVAIHVRQGGGYDSEDITYAITMKAPPIEFYIEGIQAMLDLFPDKPLYCYLFTDAKSPETIADQIREAFPRVDRLIVDYRSAGNSHDANVIEDFFSLFEFDALIHPLSNFSLVPARIHDYVAIFSPAAFSRDTKNRIVKITKTDFKINPIRYQELLQK